MEENFSAVSPITPESGLNSHIIEEGPQVCPLCTSEIRLFYIHFNEKMLMCVNTECDYPFGYEELQFVQVTNDEDISDDMSVRSRSARLSTSGSVVSASGLSDIDRINRVDDPEDCQLEPKMLKLPNKKAKKSNRKKFANRESQEQIQKNIKDLKGLNIELMEISKKRKIIKNEKWIKNLMHLQDQSGLKLVEPQELKKLNKNGNKNELKIDIEASEDSNCVSSIKIAIAN